MKTKLSLTIAAAAVAALVLAGCSSAAPDASPSPSPSAPVDADAAAAQSAADAALATVSWNEDENGVPSVTFDKPFTVGTTAARLIEDGDGAVIEADQVVSLAYTVTSGVDGSIAYSTFDNDTPEGVTLTEGQIDPVLIDLLVGAHVGAKFLYAALDGTSDTPSSVIMAVTVVSAVTPLDRAEGTAVTPAPGLPTVTLDANGVPSVGLLKTDPPKDLVVQPLIKGNGDVVEKGDTITVNYSGWLWNGDPATPFDSSWANGSTTSFVLADGQLIDGWVQGLAGQTVGSQVLLVIPSALGYGDGGSSDGSIPGGSTLVFVIDILAAT